MAVTRASSSRRSRRLRRLIPLLVLAAGAFAGGLVAGGRHQPAERRLAARFGDAWERHDYAEMYAMLTPAARRHLSVTRFARAYRDAATTATIVRLTTSRPAKPRHHTVVVPVDVSTRVFGDVHATVELPIGEAADGSPAIAWDRHLVFPGLERGEPLRRRTRMPPRATIRARDGTAIA